MDTTGFAINQARKNTYLTRLTHRYARYALENFRYARIKREEEKQQGRKEERGREKKKSIKGERNGGEGGEEGNSSVENPDAVSAADRARGADKTVPTYNNILGIRGFSDGGRVPDGLCQFESLSWFTRLAYREATWTHVRRTLTG